jgi:hypothetical protein
MRAALLQANARQDASEEDAARAERPAELPRKMTARVSLLTCLAQASFKAAHGSGRVPKVGGATRASIAWQAGAEAAERPRNACVGPRAGRSRQHGG